MVLEKIPTFEEVKTWVNSNFIEIGDPPTDHDNTNHTEEYATKDWTNSELEEYDAETPKIFAQESEPSETPEPNDGTAAIWYPLENGEYGPVHVSDGTNWIEVSLAFDFLDVDLVDDLPEPETVEKPTVAYIDETDDYVGVFQE